MSGSGEGIFLPIGVEDQFSSPMKKMVNVSLEFMNTLKKMGTAAAESAKKLQVPKEYLAGLKKAQEGLIKLRDFNVKDAMKQAKELSIAGLAVGEMFREGVKSNLEFDRTMIRMKYSGGLAKQELDALSSSAKQLASNSEFSRNDFLQSELTLKRFGATASQAMTLAGSSAAFAATNEMGLTDAVATSSKIAKLYYNDIGKTTEAQNILSLASVKTNIPITELTGTLEGLGSIAGPSGASLAQMASMLTVMSQAGMNASDAQMAVRMSMSRAAAVGMNYTTALEKVRDRYQKATTAAERMQVLAVNFGPRALKLASYFEADSKRLDSLGDSYKNAGEEVHQLNEEWENTPGQRIQKFHNQLNESFATLATPMTNVLSLGTGFLNFLGKIPGLLTTLVGAFSALAVSGWVGSMVGGFMKLWPYIVKFAPGLSKALPILGAVVGKFSLWTGAAIGLYNIIKLIVISTQLLFSKFGKQGNDFLTPYARQRLAAQQAGASGGASGSGFRVPKVTSSIINQGAQTNTGMNIHGDVILQVSAKDAGEKDSLVKTMQQQLRAKGR